MNQKRNRRRLFSFIQAKDRHELCRWVMLVVFVVVVAFLVSKYWYQVMLIQGESMSPSYHNMDMVVIDKHTKEYHVGDVIAFECQGLSAVLVKRIVAGPGDTVFISEGALYVNGEMSGLYKEEYFGYAGILEKEITLSKNEYVVIGDNIVESKDSRYEEVGVVKKEDILGILVN